MPWTLYRYMLKDLLKLLVVAAVVLVSVISFAAAIKPLSEGLLGPSTLVRFVLYTAPTMLQFALPFAAGFAASLVFLRLAADNEVLACQAAGISYKKLLAPVVALGLALTITQLILGGFVVPGFFRKAQDLVERDLMQALVTQLQGREPVTLRDYVVYADEARVAPQTPMIADSEVQPERLIMLRGVAVGEIDREGRMRRDSTAEAADMLLYRMAGQTWVTLRLREVMHYDAQRGRLFAVRDTAIPAVRLPNPFRDDVQFMSWPQLGELLEQPQKSAKVAQARQELLQAVAQERALASVRNRLARGEPIRLLGPSDEQYRVRAAGVREQGGQLLLTGAQEQPVRVNYYDAGAVVRWAEAPEAVLWVEPEQPSAEPRVRLELTDASVFDARFAASSQQSRLRVPRSRLDGFSIRPWSSLGLGALRAEAAGPQLAGAGDVADALRSLESNVDNLVREVHAQRHRRLAISLLCMLALVMGSLLSLRMRQSTPLVVYLWVFLLSLGTVLMVHTGQRMAENELAPGLAVVWGGVALACAAVLVTGWGLRRPGG